jgi:hypothetical protein
MTTSNSIARVDDLLGRLLGAESAGTDAFALLPRLGDGQALVGKPPGKSVIGALQQGETLVEFLDLIEETLMARSFAI